MTSKDLGRAAARGAGVTLGAQGIRFVLQAASLVVLSRLLTPTDFGLVAMVTAVVGIAEIIRDFGLSSAAVQAKSLSHDERNNLFWANTGIGALCGLVIAGAAPLIAGLYGDDALMAIVWALSWLLVISGMNTQFRADLSRSLRFTALAATDIVAQTLAIGAAITLAALGGGYWAIVVQQIVVVCVGCLGNMIQAGWIPGRYRRGVSLRPFFRYGGGLLGMQALGYITNNVDNIAIGAAWGPAQLGFYSRAYQLLIVPLNQLSTALTRVVLPVLARVQDDRERLLRYLQRAQLICLYLFGVGFAVAAGLAEPLVAIVFGDGWATVAPIFAVLALGGMFRGYAQLTYWLCLAKGLTGSQLKLYLVVRPVMIACLLAGLPWGALGVAVGHTVAFALDWIISAWWIGRKSGTAMGPFIRQTLRSLLLVCLPAAALARWGSTLVENAAASLAVGAVMALVYLLVVLLVLPTERRHVRQMVQMLGKLRRGR